MNLNLNYLTSQGFMGIQKSMNLMRDISHFWEAPTVDRKNNTARENQETEKKQEPVGALARVLPSSWAFGSQIALR